MNKAIMGRTMITPGLNQERPKQIRALMSDFSPTMVLSMRTS